MTITRYKSKAHQGAYRKGRGAYKNGEPRSACPYDYDDRCGDRKNIVTGARGFARAWYAGWDDANKCPKCNGQGTVRAGFAGYRRCSECDGTGKKKDVDD